MELLRELPVDIQMDIAKRLTWSWSVDFQTRRLYVSVFDIVHNSGGDEELAHIQMLASLEPPLFDEVWLDVYHDYGSWVYCYGRSPFTCYLRVPQCDIDSVACCLRQFPHLLVREEEENRDRDEWE
jgi:hypothetical protein